MTLPECPPDYTCNFSMYPSWTSAFMLGALIFVIVVFIVALTWMSRH